MVRELFTPHRLCERAFGHGSTRREAGQVELFSRRRLTNLPVTQTLKNVVLSKVTILLWKATRSELSLLNQRLSTNYNTAGPG